MSHPRIISLTLLAFTLLPGFPAAAQSVISTHAGVVYFFAGAVFIGGERLEQKFGKFPDIGDGRELRTEHGRAEVLLTPGVFLRVAENSAIRLVSGKLSDARVEFLRGSAILESTDTSKGTSVTLTHQNWAMHIAHQGVYRIDSAPPQVQVYKGEVEVLADAKAGSPEPAKVMVKEGEVLPLAAVLVAERSSEAWGDDFKTWAMNRSQAIAADDATAAGIIDDPNQMDAGAVALGGVTYFPSGGITSLGINNPYGLSFWSPYQSMLSSIYFPPYMYGAYLPVYGSVYGRVGRGWPGGVSSYSNGIHSLPRPGYQRPIYPAPIQAPWRITHPGFGVGRSTAPSYGAGVHAVPRIAPPAPHVVSHPGGGAVHAGGGRR